MAAGPSACFDALKGACAVLTVSRDIPRQAVWNRRDGARDSMTGEEVLCQDCDGHRDERRGCPEASAVSGLVRNTGEHADQVGPGVPDPPGFGGVPEQLIGHHRAEQFRFRQFRLAGETFVLGCLDMGTKPESEPNSPSQRLAPLKPSFAEGSEVV